MSNVACAPVADNDSDSGQMHFRNNLALANTQYSTSCIHGDIVGRSNIVFDKKVNLESSLDSSVKSNDRQCSIKQHYPISGMSQSVRNINNNIDFNSDHCSASFTHSCSDLNSIPYSRKCPCMGNICIYDINRGFSAHNYQFGFIPLEPLEVFTTATFVPASKTAPLPYALHGAPSPNCIGHRIQIQTAFNIPKWESYLREYWDHQLIYFIKYGFPLDILRTGNFKAQTVIKNHTSALQYRPHVQEFLDTEVQLGAILGPFSGPVQGLHCSPMMSRPKPGSEDRRIIVDLSWPSGGSLNDHVQDNMYMGTPFVLKFPVVDDILDRIKLLQGDCLLYKVDLKRAFRQLKIDPRDTIFTGLNFKDKFYIDLSVPFGYKHGSAICQRLTDGIRYIMHSHGYYIFNYIDDLIGCDKPGVASDGFKFLNQLLLDLGLPISIGKSCPPSTSVTCLGIIINIKQGIITIPEDKLCEIHNSCIQWSTQTRATKNQLQSIAGQLLYVHKCVKPARLFVNRILATLRRASPKGYIELDNAFLQDIRWFTKFIKIFNGTVYYSKTLEPPITNLYLDACLTGMGGTFQNQAYACPINRHTNVDSVELIVHLEMLNILIALRLWSKQFAGKRVVVHCDNLAVVYILQSGKTKDPFLGAVARNIFCLAAQYDIELIHKHIYGVKNIAADLLSRWFNPGTNTALIYGLIPHLQWSQVTTEMCTVDYNI